MPATKKASRTSTPSLPTMQSAGWAMSHFRDSATQLLNDDTEGSELRLYFYAATRSGWSLLSPSVDRWMKRKPNRPVSAYLGTDHALTDPDAIEAMHQAGVSVFLVRHYRGVFHPKVIWFVRPSGGVLLSGSNNLTEDGLSNNIEFATLTTLTIRDSMLEQWHHGVHSASDPYSDALLRSYRTEKESFGKARAKSGNAKTFTWSKRTSGRTPPSGAPQALPAVDVLPGDLVLEVMPRETSSEGRQIQIPIAVANIYFRLGSATKASKQLSLINEATSEERRLTMTRNKNHTTRLSIRELEYRSRPCVLRVRKHGPNKFSVLIVRQSIDPGGYSRLLAMCPQTPPNRRWTLVKKAAL